MTDSFDQEPTQDLENEAVTEAPPEGEFSDELLPEELPASEPVAPRSPLLPVVAVVGGVVLLGAVAFWQLGNGSFSSLFSAQKTEEEFFGKTAASKGGPETAQSLITPKTDSVTPRAETASSPVPSAVAPSSFQENQGDQESPADAEEKETLDTTGPIVAKPLLSNVAPRPVSNALPNEGVPSLVAAPSAPVVAKAIPLPTMEKQATAPTLAQAAPVATAPSAQPVPAPAAAKATEEATQRINALNEQVSSLQKALELANQQISQLNKTLEEKTVAKVPAEKPAKKIKASTAKTGAVEPVADETKAAQPVEPAQEKPANVRKTKAKAVSKVSLTKKAPAKSWVLRAASPDKAWISENASSTELKEVHIGDTVPEIGKVTSIAAENDAWIVRGTKGQIK